jgi:hypothetical protein
MTMYWNATRFLWRVFTHPKNPGMRERASDRIPPKIATPYRLFTLQPLRASMPAEDHSSRPRQLERSKEHARV